MIGWENPQRTVCPSLVVGRGCKSQRWQSGKRRVPSSQHTGMGFFKIINCEFSFQFEIVPVIFSHLRFKFKQTIRRDLWGTLSPPFPSPLIRPGLPFISNVTDKTGVTADSAAHLYAEDAEFFHSGGVLEWRHPQVLLRRSPRQLWNAFTLSSHFKTRRFIKNVCLSWGLGTKLHPRCLEIDGSRYNGDGPWVVPPWGGKTRSEWRCELTVRLHFPSF